jgi:hypothetical protein
MPSWVLQALGATPWAAVALFVIDRAYRLAMARVVRDSPTRMTVKDKPIAFELDRGDAQPRADEAYPPTPGDPLLDPSPLRGVAPPTEDSANPVG